MCCKCFVSIYLYAVSYNTFVFLFLKDQKDNAFSNTKTNKYTNKKTHKTKQQLKTLRKEMICKQVLMSFYSSSLLFFVILLFFSQQTKTSLELNMKKLKKNLFYKKIYIKIIEKDEKKKKNNLK